MEKGKQPKETDDIKRKLESFAALQRKIDNAIGRLESLTLTMGSPSTPNLTGLPSGGGDGTSKTERQVIRKLELEELIDRMEKPDEQTVIQMRYLDGSRWWPICAALYSNEADYAEKADKYLKRTFKLHGSALQTLARIDRAETTA